MIFSVQRLDGRMEQPILLHYQSLLTAILSLIINSSSTSSKETRVDGQNRQLITDNYYND